MHSFLNTGHTGIADSKGTIYDFAGPYTIGVGKLTFSAPTRYIVLDPARCSLQGWDEGVREGCEIYKGRMHNIVLDNCHSHVAKCLNIMGYGKILLDYVYCLTITFVDKKSDYEMIRIGVWVFFSGKFVSVGSFVQTYLPFTIIVLIIAFLSGFFS